MIQVLLALNLFLFSSIASAGHEVGNGGNVVICKNEKGEKQVELLDFSEAKLLNHSFKLEMGESNLNFYQKLDYVINRLSRISPNRANRYKNTILNILKSNPFIEGDLTGINDSGHVALAQNCELKQAAIRINPEIDMYSRKWVFSKSLYDQLDDESKIGILLHEAIYDEAISLGINNSTGVRFFNSLINSNEMNFITFPNFISTLKKINFNNFEYNDVPVWLTPSPETEITFYENNSIRRAYTIENSAITINGISFLIWDFIYFYPNGNIASFSPSQKYWEEGCINQFFLNENREIIAAKISNGHGEFCIDYKKNQSKLTTDGLCIKKDYLNNFPIEENIDLSNKCNDEFPKIRTFDPPPPQIVF